MVTRRMRQLEARVRAKVTDPSLLAWYAKRDALGPNQSDLFRMWVFTDDPHFVAVGFTGGSASSAVGEMPCSWWACAWRKQPSDKAAQAFFGSDFASTAHLVR